ncbi:helix-turn-helix domain-containing protein [Thauera aminoaromatica]|uniref:helix-turn-helix domain-containing protein n=1 Tax=Thauera aminoaromatica TaxID=164330 RepID=UPI0035B007B2
MSTGATAWAWSLELPPAQKLLALAICDAMNHDGECWIGHERLAVLTGLSARHVRRTLPELCKSSGLLMDVGRRGDGGYARAHYQLPAGVLAALDEWRQKLRDLRAGRGCAMPVRTPPADTMSGGGSDTMSVPHRTPCPMGSDTMSDGGSDTMSDPTRARARARGSLSLDESKEEDARAQARAKPAAADEPAAQTEKTALDPAALHWPTLKPQQRGSIGRRLQKAGLDAPAAQDVLDVLAARLALPSGVKEPSTYVAALIRHQQAGTLEIEDAAPIRATRQAHARAEAQAAASRAAASPPTAAAIAAPRAAASSAARAALKRAARGARSQEETPS